MSKRKIITTANWIGVISLICLVNSCCSDIKCNSDIKQYLTLEYQILEKVPIDTIENEILFNATVHIKDRRAENLLSLLIYPDSVICYCLAICKSEAIVRANFFTIPEGREILQKNSIEYFSHEQIRKSKLSNKEIDEILGTCFGSLYIENLNRNWKANLNSKNFKSTILRININDNRKYGCSILKIDD